MSSSTSNRTVGLPLDKEPDDLLVAILASSSGVVATYPTGWVKLYEGANSAGGLSIAVKKVELSDSNTMQVALSSSFKGGSLVYNIRNASGLVAAGPATNDRTPLPATAPWGLNKNMFLAAIGSGTHGGSGFTGAPGGFSDVASATSTSGTNNRSVGAAVAYERADVFGASSGFVGGGGSVHSLILAIQPEV